MLGAQGVNGGREHEEIYEDRGRRTRRPNRGQYRVVTVPVKSSRAWVRRRAAAMTDWWNGGRCPINDAKGGRRKRRPYRGNDGLMPVPRDRPRHWSMGGH